MFIYIFTLGDLNVHGFCSPSNDFDLYVYGFCVLTNASIVRAYIAQKNHNQKCGGFRCLRPRAAERCFPSERPCQNCVEESINKQLQQDYEKVIRISKVLLCHNSFPLGCLNVKIEFLPGLDATTHTTKNRRRNRITLYEISRTSPLHMKTRLKFGGRKSIRKRRKMIQLWCQNGGDES